MIENLIISYLNRHGKVTIPTLGTLISTNENVSFLSFLKSNDGSLCKYITENIPVSIDEANEIVNTFAQEVVQTIDVEGEYLLWNFGALKKDINKLIYLEQKENKIEFSNNISTVAVEFQAVNVEIVGDNLDEFLDSNNLSQVSSDHALSAEIEINNLIIEQIEIEENQQIQAIADEIIIVKAVIQEEEKISLNDVATINRQRTFADTVTQNLTMWDINKNTNAENNTLANSCCENIIEKQNDKLVESNLTRNIENIEALVDSHQESIESCPLDNSFNDKIEEQESLNEVAKPNAVIDNYEKSPEDKELLEKLQDSKNKKARLFNLYEAVNEVGDSELNVGNSTPAVKEHIYQASDQGFKKPKKSGPDAVIVVSVIAILLAIVVSVYYFMVRV